MSAPFVQELFRRISSVARHPASVALLALLPTMPRPTWSQEVADPARGGAIFLLLPVGARAAALGQAAIADAGHSEAAFWNPAGLALLPRAEFAIHYSSTFASNNTAISAYLAPNRLGVLGISGYLVDLGSQEIAPGPGPPIGRLSVKNIELLVSYATTVAGDLAFGVNYKLIQFRQDCSGDCSTTPTAVGTTHGVDVGVQYAFGGNDDLRVGLAVRHAGFKLQIQNRDQADPLPTRVQAGIVYRVRLPQPAGVEEALDARILFDLQDEWGQYNDPDARVGLEIGYGDMVRIRTGYAFLHSESRGLSVGLGLRFGQFALDFARIIFDSSNFDEPVHISLRVAL
ncbi:MAG: PorV/PorQ family protein [Gemmatimonadales bacterium]|nr:PorV/PorQ family protein [Gemmatimonadales bacterium]